MVEPKTSKFKKYELGIQIQKTQGKTKGKTKEKLRKEKEKEKS